MPTRPETKLRASGIRKVYPGALALDDVSISFEAGKVHALLGKNGAGKSTLIKILAGATRPTAGAIEVDSQRVELDSPLDAFRKGIATVYQDLSLIPGLSVAENILFGRLPHRAGLWRVAIDWPRVFAEAGAVLAQLGVNLDVRARVSSLGIAAQQVVEIAKAMSFKPAVLMLDEPTSALAHHESQALFRLIRQLARQGVAIIYISHRLQELREIVDTVSVLRDGRLVGTIAMAAATPKVIAELMFGQVVKKRRPADLRVGDEVVLKTNGLTRQGRFAEINLTLRRGEILGLAGMVGAGRTSLLMAIFGAEPADSGSIEVVGERVAQATPRRMKSLGIGLTPENRKEQALVQQLSTRDNICLASLGRIARFGFINHERQRPVVERSIAELQIKLPGMMTPVSSLSGGNQQKVAVGNWLNTRPRVMLFDEPTRGIDVEAKQQIFQLIWQLSRRGISSILVSSELEELIEVCHRIVVMRKGRIVGELAPEGLELGGLLALCMEE